MKVMKFASDLVPLIMSGEKTSTWRLFDDKDFQAGDSVEFLDKQTMNKFAIAKLLDVQEKPLGEMTDEEKKGHEIYESEDEMYRTFEGYYKRKVGPETKIKIIRFELLQ